MKKFKKFLRKIFKRHELKYCIVDLFYHSYNTNTVMRPMRPITETFKTLWGDKDDPLVIGIIDTTTNELYIGSQLHGFVADANEFEEIYDMKILKILNKGISDEDCLEISLKYDRITPFIFKHDNSLWPKYVQKFIHSTEANLREKLKLSLVEEKRRAYHD